MPFGHFEIMKRTKSGTVLWNRLFAGKLDISELIFDREDNLIIIGNYLDTVVIGNRQFIQPPFYIGSFIAKLDEDGNFLWAKEASELSTGIYSLGTLETDASNNIILAAHISISSTGIFKLDHDGNVISSINQSDVTLVSDMTIDNSGNIWAAGFTNPGLQSFNGLDTIAPFGYNNYVVKYDQSGIARWVLFIEDATVQRFKIVSDNSGNAYLSGNIFIPTQFGTLFANGPQWVYDYFVTKINPEGNFVWLQEIPPGNTMGDAAAGTSNHLACSEDGTVYFTGFFRGNVDFGNGVTVSQIGSYDVLVISYSSDGEVRWAAKAGSTAFDQGGGIVIDGGGNTYLTGFVGENSVFGNFAFTGGQSNFFIARVHDDQIVTSIPSITSLPETFSLKQNYPNPFNPTTKISFSIPSAEFISIKVYNVLGNEIATLVDEEKSAGQYEIIFDASKHTSGVYFYKLLAGNFSETKKMVLLK